jgi:hypothetical protein
MRKGGRWGQCEIGKDDRDREWWKNKEKGKGRRLNLFPGQLLRTCEPAM